MATRIKWTEALLLEFTKKYSTIKDFRELDYSAYLAVKRLKLQDKVCSHLLSLKSDWSLENLKAESKKYTSVSEFINNSPLAYQAIKKKKLNDLISHLEKKDAWTIEKVLAESKQFKSFNEFRKKLAGAYKAAVRFGIAEDIRDDLGEVNRKWDAESIADEALKYDTLSDFIKSGSPYVISKRLGIFKEVTSHMERGKNQWTPEDALAIASHYSNPTDLMEANSACYYYLRSKGILHESLNNSVRKNKATAEATAARLERIRIKDRDLKRIKNNYTGLGSQALIRWNLERVRSYSLQCTARTEFFKKFPNAYDAALRNKWLDDVCSHMEIQNKKTENNVVYLWKALELTYNGLPVYKIGITSTRAGSGRIRFVAKQARVTAEIITIRLLNIKATEIERKLHQLGDDPKYTGFNGCTEFRAMNEVQLKEAIALIKEHAA